MTPKSIKEKAKELSDSHSTPDENNKQFSASNGWCQNFMKRYGLLDHGIEKDPESLQQNHGVGNSGGNNSGGNSLTEEIIRSQQNIALLPLPALPPISPALLSKLVSRYDFTFLKCQLQFFVTCILSKNLSQNSVF